MYAVQQQMKNNICYVKGLTERAKGLSTVETGFKEKYIKIQKTVERMATLRKKKLKKARDK